MPIYGSRKVRKGCGAKIKEWSGQQSHLGGAECLEDEVSTYPSLKGGQVLNFYT